MVEAVIEAIRVNVVNDAHVVVLREADGQRMLPIWITTDVANAIAVVLQGAESPRPLTHDLLRSVIDEMGGRVERVIVADLRDGVFHATLEIAADGRTIRIDSRSSDAIALAVRVGSPIFVEDHVLEQAGFLMSAEAPEPAQEDAGPASEPIDPQRLSVFREFVNNLDMDDPKRETE